MKRRGLVIIGLALITALAGGMMVMAQDGGERQPISPANAGQLAELAVLDTQSQEAYDTAWSEDGRWLAVANSNGVWLYNVADLSAGARELDADATLVTSLAFSPDGALLATGSADGGVRVTDTASGERRALINAHNAIVTDVAFSPDGALLASASVDGSARLWNPIDGQGLAVLAGPANVVSRVAFSPDGTLLYVTDMDDRHRIVAYNLEGAPMLSFNQPDNLEAGELGLRSPAGLAVDETGRIYVVDAEQNKVFVFPPSEITGSVLPIPLQGSNALPDATQEATEAVTEPAAGGGG